MSQRVLFTLLLTIVMLAVSACSDESNTNNTDSSSDDATTPTETAAEETTEPADDAETEDVESDETEASDETEIPSDAAGVREISHALGTREIEGTPERVVVLEWTYAEDILALGMQPVGAADIENFHTWVQIDEELSDDVVDVGTRQEPNLETIAELEPDLIIGVQFRHEPIYDNLESIAPTLLFNPYPEDESVSQHQEMEETFMSIAKAVDREAEAEDVLERLNASYQEAEEQLASSDLETEEFLLVQAFTSEDSPQMRLFIDNGMATQILESLGLENAYEGEFDVYGFNTVGIEALVDVQHANFIYVAQADDDPFQEQWADNPVWNDLTFVQEDRVYPLSGDTWLFGGPLSAMVFADEVVTKLSE